jgi:hypothetical protein
MTQASVPFRVIPTNGRVMRKFVIIFAAAVSLSTIAATANAEPSFEVADGVPSVQLAQYNGGYNYGGSYNYKNSRDALDTCRYC